MGLVKDPVTPEVAAEVFARDQGCIAPRFGAETRCSDRWGQWIPPNRPLAAQIARHDLTLDHVPAEPGARRVSSPRWLVTGCWGHMVYEHWETANRDKEREHLAALYPEQKEE